MNLVMGTQSLSHLPRPRRRESAGEGSGGEG